MTDGVFLRRRPEGPLEFIELPAPTPEQVTAIAWETCRRAQRILERHGLWEDEGPGGEDALAASEPGLADLYQASVRGRIALGGRRGQRLVCFIGEAATDDEEGPRPHRSACGPRSAGERGLCSSYARGHNGAGGDGVSHFYDAARGRPSRLSIRGLEFRARSPLSAAESESVLARP